MTFHDFFTIYFPDSALVAADFTRKDKQILAQCIPSRSGGQLDKSDLNHLKHLNKDGAGIYFTPNAVLHDKAGVHSSDNFWYVNSCYVDIDSPTTKTPSKNEDFDRREETIADMLGFVFMLKLMPSMTVRTRNALEV